MIFPDLDKYMSRFGALEQQVKKEFDTYANPDPERPKAKTVSTIKKNPAVMLNPTLDAGTVEIAQKIESNAGESVADADEGGFMSQMFGAQGDYTGGIMDSLGFINQLGTNLSTTSPNDAAAAMNALNMTMTGAQAGMKFGGPIGAAIGGTAGLVVGGIDMFGDRKKRNEEAQNNYISALEEKSKTRAMNFNLEKSEKELDALKSVQERNLMNVNHSMYG